MVKGKMSHFVAFFVHFDKLIRPHPGPLCPRSFSENHIADFATKFDKSAYVHYGVTVVYI